MRGRVAQALKKLALEDWNRMPLEYKKVLSVKMVYKRIKKEFKDEKRR